MNKNAQKIVIAGLLIGSTLIFYMTAIHFKKKSAKLIPENTRALLKSALVNLHNQNKQQALRDLEQALKISPDSDEINHFLGMIYYQEGNFAQSYPFFQTAYAHNPDDIDNLLYLALTTFLAKSQAEGEKLFDKAIAESPNDSFAVRFIAAELYGHGHPNEALSYLNPGAQFFDKDAETWILLGKMYANLGQYTKAIQCWHYVLTFAPDQKEVHQLLAENKDRPVVLNY